MAKIEITALSLINYQRTKTIITLIKRALRCLIKELSKILFSIGRLYAENNRLTGTSIINHD